MAEETTRILAELAVQRTMQREILVIPMYFRPAELGPFDNFQILPKNARPVMAWDDQVQETVEQVRQWDEVLEGIQEAVAFLTAPSQLLVPNTLEIYYSHALSDLECADQLEEALHTLEFPVPVLRWHKGKLIAGQTDRQKSSTICGGPQSSFCWSVLITWRVSPITEK